MSTPRTEDEWSEWEEYWGTERRNAELAAENQRAFLWRTAYNPYAYDGSYDPRKDDSDVEGEGSCYDPYEIRDRDYWSRLESYTNGDRQDDVEGGRPMGDGGYTYLNDGE